MSFVEPFPIAAVEAIGRAGWIAPEVLARAVDRVRLIRRPVHDAITAAAWIAALRTIAVDDAAAAQAYEDTLASHAWFQRVGDPDLPSIHGAHPRVRAEFERLMAIGRSAAVAAQSRAIAGRGEPS